MKGDCNTGEADRFGDGSFEVLATQRLDSMAKEQLELLAQLNAINYALERFITEFYGPDLGDKAEGEPRPNDNGKSRYSFEIAPSDKDCPVALRVANRMNRMDGLTKHMQGLAACICYKAINILNTSISDKRNGKEHN